MANKARPIIGSRYDEGTRRVLVTIVVDYGAEREMALHYLKRAEVRQVANGWGIKTSASDTNETILAATTAAAERASSLGRTFVAPVRHEVKEQRETTTTTTTTSDRYDDRRTTFDTDEVDEPTTGQIDHQNDHATPPAAATGTLDELIGGIATSYVRGALADHVRETAAVIDAKISEVMRPQITNVRVGERAPVVIEGRVHALFPAIVEMLSNAVGNTHVYIYGAPGSGKSTLATQVATAMSLPITINSCGDETASYLLQGYVHAGTGEVYPGLVDVMLCKCQHAGSPECDCGGCLFLDELDACPSGALLWLNDLLAARSCTIPTERRKQGERVAMGRRSVLLGAGNTLGRGATKDHNARGALDVSSLDRFKILKGDYDRELERHIATTINAVNGPAIATKVQAWRDAAHRLNVSGTILTTRAIIGWCEQFNMRSLSAAEVETACVWRGVASEVVARIKSEASVA